MVVLKYKTNLAISKICELPVIKFEWVLFVQGDRAGRRTFQRSEDV